ncbi:sulfoxide reductase heme-binding subunit YedZ [Cardiobacteriaceae bacterium TAE3-ERU3]|nr:sulfoxide reductase heme-binding subunit YedZ [Cardiobacteriaceae bacterium TAE3-ERU3]
MKINKRMLPWKIGGHLLGIAPLGYIVWLSVSGRLGFDPVKELIHALGFSAVLLLMATLLVTPLRKQFRKLAPLIGIRRLLGLWTFFWACAHVLAFAWLELGWDVAFLAQEIVKRPYMLVGMAAWVLLFALAVTSTRGMQRRLGKRWLTLHRSIYAIALLVGIHYWWSLKIVNAGDLGWIFALWIIVALRWLPVWRRTAVGSR